MKINFISCHRKSNRSFFWKDKQFPLCARCTGIYVGYLTLPFFIFRVFEFSWLFSFLIILPTIIDGLSQAYFDRESINLIRVGTGFFAGLGITSVIHLSGEKIGILILNIL